jgi:hypothetical protein
MPAERSFKTTMKNFKRILLYSRKSGIARSRTSPKSIARLLTVSTCSWPMPHTTKKVAPQLYTMLSSTTNPRKSMLVNQPNALPDPSNQHIPGCDPGDHLTLAKLQDLVAEDQELQNLSSAHKKELKDNVIASRKLKVMGVQASNLGAAMDSKATMERVDQEVCDWFLLHYCWLS